MNIIYAFSNLHKNMYDVHSKTMYNADSKTMYDVHSSRV